MMSQKDVEEFAAMIAQMQDDKSFHPKYNKKGDKTLPNKRGPNDLEEQIRVLEFRNAKLHNHNEKIEREILELRNKIKKLEALQTDQFRNKGDM
jgi:predicted RNase H-like nuclease (RuvC/YqgF family)